MLGKTAGSLFWMFRYLERSENTARLIETGFRIALTRPPGEDDEWASILQTASATSDYQARYDAIEGPKVIDFLLRDATNPSSVLSCISAARQNARTARTALTREVWEAVNDTYMRLKTRLSRPVPLRDLPEVLGLIRQQSALVRGALHGTTLRNDAFDFCRLGTFLERADNTARILDVKYYVLLPSITQIGSSLDNVQWETILRSVSGERAYNWLMGEDSTPKGIANFLLFDGRMPRSLAFSVSKLTANLGYLERAYGERRPSQDLSQHLNTRLQSTSIETVFEEGLHEFLVEALSDLNRLGLQVQTDYRFLD